MPTAHGHSNDAAIRDVAHALAEAESPAALFESIAETARTIVQASAAYVEQLSIQKETVVIVAAVGRGVPSAGTQVPYPGSLTQELIERYADAAPELFPDLTQQDRPIGRILRQTCGPCAALVMPLRSATELYGVLVLLRPHDESPFTEADAERLQPIADMAAIAFKRSHLLEQLQVEHDRLRRSEHRAQLIAEIGRVLGSSLNYEETLRNAAQLSVPVFADWCTVDVLEPKGTGIRRIALAHEDPAQAAYAAELERRYPPTMQQASGVMEVIRTGEPKLWAEIPPHMIKQSARDERHAQILDALGLMSAMIVPITAQHRTLGAISFVSSSELRRYDEADLQFAVAFGERAGVAIENARLHTAAVESTGRLQELLNRIGDAFCAFDRDWKLTYANPAAERLLHRLLGINTKELVARSLWRVVPQLVDTAFEDALREAMNQQRPTHAEEFFEPGGAWIETSVYPSSEGVSVFARDVSERRRSQSALAILAEAGARVAAATDYATTLQEVVHAVVPSFADYCVIDLAATADGLHRAAFAHREVAGQAILEALTQFPPHPDDRLGEPYRTGRPLLIERVEAADVDSFAQASEHRVGIEQLGPRSMLVAPLIARGHTLGIMIFARTAASGQYYTASDIELASELGRRAGSAVEKARLQRDLERALRARDDVLAVVAHDLRNPIATIAMSASLMQESYLSEADRVRQIEIIRRGTQRANRLIADLLDVAQIEAGKLALNRTTVDVDALMREICELFKSLAAERRLGFECHVDEHLPPIAADHDRVMQVFSNLLGNAIKFTPETGSIHVTAHPRGSEIEFAVSDTGQGITPDALPHVFEQFWQAKRGRGGAGLGLAIVKGIVDAHGGCVTVQSTPGQGTTFTFTLPRA